MGEVSGYLANQLGFSETGRYVLDNLIKPRISKIGICINDPFEECGKEIDFKHLGALELHEAVRKYWADFSDKVNPINDSLMEKSDCMLAVLDGGHALDDGVSGEIGYYAGIKRGPIFALRSDFRCGENIAVTINPQILGYIKKSKGTLVDGPGALEGWFTTIQNWYDSLKNTIP